MRPFVPIITVGLISVGLATARAFTSPADDARGPAPETLRVAVDGPLPADKPARIEGKESPFVKPHHVEAIRLGPNTAFVDVRFEFKGPERRSRRIEVKFLAKGPDGRIVAEGLHTCSDQRIYARKNSGKPLGTRAAHFDPMNSEKFKVPADALDEIRTVEVEFRETKANK